MRVVNRIREKEFDDIAKLAIRLSAASSSLIYCFEERKVWIKSSIGEHEIVKAEELEFTFSELMKSDCVSLERGNQFFGDCFTDRKVGFFCAIALKDEDGRLLGALAVLDREAKSLDEEQLSSLKILAGTLQSLITEKNHNHKLNHYEKLFQLSLDLVCLASTDGFFKKVSPSFNKILGWDDQTLLGKPFLELVHPDDLDKTFDELEKLSQGLPTINFTHRFGVLGGDYKVLQWMATPEKGTGNIFAIGRDVTEETKIELRLTESEEKLRVFFENSHGLMCTHDLEGNFLSVNSAGAAILGYTVDEILSRSLFDIIPDDRIEQMHSYLAAISSTGKASGQMLTKHKDGTLFTWLFNNVLEKSGVNTTQYVIGNALDITKKASLELDLHETKRLLEETATVARVGGWYLDPIGGQVSWTPMTRAIHEADESFKPTVESGIDFFKEGESRDAIVKAVDKAISSGDSWDLEVQMITVKGKELWVRSIGQAKFENGVCTQIFGTFQDIDKQKKSELEAIRAKKALDDVFKASSEVSVIATDMDGNITLFNIGAEKMLGYTAEEMVGKNTPEKIHSKAEIEKVAEELSEKFGRKIEGLEVYTAVAERTGSEQRDWTYIRKDGSERLVSVAVTPIKNVDSISVGYLGIAIDITEKRKIERELIIEKSRLSEFVLHTPAAVAMLDKDMKYIAASNRWILDYKLEGKEIIGASHYDILQGTLKEGARERHNRILGGAVERKEEEVYRLPGFEEEQYVTWEMRPWYLYGGEVGGVMLFTQNITAMIKQREELKAAKIQADQASKAKSEFLANMSHEIRTPLNGVIGFTDLVLKTKMNQTQYQYLSIVNQSGNALLSIINDILDFSKIEAGKLELHIDKCDLYEMCSQATDIITYQIQNRGLEMLLNIDFDIPRFIYADGDRLKQVLINLLGNASKFTEKGEIELRIENLQAEGDFNKIRFSVRDSGIGIDPAKQKKIFEAFSQEDNSTTKKFGGTGLGLTISNRLLDLMDSKLQLESSVGVGSTFFFEVTFKTELGEAVEWSGIEQIKKVLVVDDNENNRLIVNQMLLLKNIKTVEAASGLEAIHILSLGERFDVIIMDYHMPFMNGLDAIREIKENYADRVDEMPIMLLHSSSDDQKIIQTCKELGVYHRLVKPVKLQDFYHALSRIHILKDEFTNQIEEEPELHYLPYKVLIAEDNQVNMMLVETIVLRAFPNAKIQKAKNGIEAVNFYKEEVPDIILMDLQMSEMNGFEATESIRKISEGTYVPIVALTAGNVKGERERCLAIGMSDYIMKPVVEKTLKAVFKRWLSIDSENKEEVLMENHYDKSVLISITGNNTKALERILKSVKSELKEMLSELEKNIEKEDLQRINEVGHKLYGTAVYSGMPILIKMAVDIEHLKSVDTASLKRKFNIIKKEVELVLKGIDNPTE